jgi:hypothetical protein
LRPRSRLGRSGSIEAGPLTSAPGPRSKLGVKSCTDRCAAKSGCRLASLSQICECWDVWLCAILVRSITFCRGEEVVCPAPDRIKGLGLFQLAGNGPRPFGWNRNNRVSCRALAHPRRARTLRPRVEGDCAGAACSPTILRIDPPITPVAICLLARAPTPPGARIQSPAWISPARGFLRQSRSRALSGRPFS